MLKIVYDVIYIHENLIFQLLKYQRKMHCIFEPKLYKTVVSFYDIKECFILRITKKTFVPKGNILEMYNYISYHFCSYCYKFEKNKNKHSFFTLV